jgi:hypothetical protein
MIRYITKGRRKAGKEPDPIAVRAGTPPSDRL